MRILRKLLFLGAIALPFFVPAVVHAAPATVNFMSSDADLPAAFVEKFNKENPDKITIVRTEPDYTKMVAEAAAGKRVGPDQPGSRLRHRVLRAAGTLQGHHVLFAE